MHFIIFLASSVFIYEQAHKSDRGNNILTKTFSHFYSELEREWQSCKPAKTFSFLLRSSVDGNTVIT